MTFYKIIWSLGSLIFSYESIIFSTGYNSKLKALEAKEKFKFEYP